jgi:hypothetical protein
MDACTKAYSEYMKRGLLAFEKAMGLDPGMRDEDEDYEFSEPSNEWKAAWSACLKYESKGK